MQGLRGPWDVASVVGDDASPRWREGARCWVTQVTPKEEERTDCVRTGRRIWDIPRLSHLSCQT